MKAVFQPVQVTLLVLIAGYSFGNFMGLGIAACILLFLIFMDF